MFKDGLTAEEREQHRLDGCDFKTKLDRRCQHCRAFDQIAHEKWILTRYDLRFLKGLRISA